MSSVQVSPFASATVDGTGAAQCSIGPPSMTRWQLALANVSVRGAQGAALTKQSTCTLYRGSAMGPDTSQQVDVAIGQGNSAASGKVAAVPFFQGQLLWAVWSGADPGATAMLSCSGLQAARGDPPFLLGPVGEGFASQPATITIGVPGGAFLFIGSPIPAELTAYYAGFVLGAAYIREDPTGGGYHYEVWGRSAAANLAWATGWVRPDLTVIQMLLQEFFPAGPFSQTRIGNSSSDGLDNRLAIDVGFFDIKGTCEIDGALSLFADYQQNGVSQARGVAHYEQITTSFTSTAVAGSEQVAYTTANVTFTNGRAYRVTVKFGLQSAVLQQPLVSVRETNLAGTLLCNGPRVPLPVAAISTLVDRQFLIKNTTGADVVTPLAITVTPQIATAVTQNGGAVPLLAYVEVVDVGASGDYAAAISVT
jgi:hypothetical protein